MKWSLAVEDIFACVRQIRIEAEEKMAASHSRRDSDESGRLRRDAESLLAMHKRAMEQLEAL